MNQKIIELRKAGLTFAQIAKKLNLTKGQVAGVVYRDRVRKQKEGKVEIQKHKTIMQLRDGDCRWVIEGYAEARFCGEHIHKGSYCKSHAAIVYIKPKKDGKDAA